VAGQSAVLNLPGDAGSPRKLTDLECRRHAIRFGVTLATPTTRLADADNRRLRHEFQRPVIGDGSPLHDATGLALRERFNLAPPPRCHCHRRARAR